MAKSPQILTFRRIILRGISLFVTAAIIWLGVLFLQQGCGKVVSTGTTTTSSTSTTSAAYSISGTISNYFGGTTEVLVAILDRSGGSPVTGDFFSVSGSEINYYMPLTSEGSYYVFSADYDIGGDVTPEVNNWIGGYGWAGTASIETAGSSSLTLNRLTSNFQSLEVTGAATADFTLHQIIDNPAYDGQVTVTGSVTDYVTPPDNDLYVQIVSLGSGSGGGSVLAEIVSGTTYNYTLTVEGSTYIVTAHSTNMSTPEVGGYLGAYGWAGTDPVSQEVASATLFSSAAEIVLSTEVVNLSPFTVHEVVP